MCKIFDALTNPEWWQAFGAIGGLIGVWVAYKQIREDNKGAKAQMDRMKELIAETAAQTNLMGEYNKIFQASINAYLSQTISQGELQKSAYETADQRHKLEIRPFFINAGFGHSGLSGEFNFGIRNSGETAFKINSLPENESSLRLRAVENQEIPFERGVIRQIFGTILGEVRDSNNRFLLFYEDKEQNHYYQVATVSFNQTKVDFNPPRPYKPSDNLLPEYFFSNP